MIYICQIYSYKKELNDKLECMNHIWSQKLYIFVVSI